DDAVIVLELVGELQCPARLAFRLFGERDSRRLVRDGGELPGDVARGGAANGRRPGVVDDEAPLFGALGVAALCARGRLRKPAACDHIEVNSGRADDQHASRRHRKGGGALHRLAPPQPPQDHPRAAPAQRRGRFPGGRGVRGGGPTKARVGNLAAITPPCKSNAGAMRSTRPPPAAKNVATTNTATKARTAKGSRSASRGIGVPALSVLAARRARSIWARHSATEKESSVGAAISSAIAVAGRCGRPELRSSHRK